MRDDRSFFDVRSVVMADGVLTAILMPCRKEGAATSNSTLLKGFECWWHALIRRYTLRCTNDVITQPHNNLWSNYKQGLVEEELGDSFNLPIFIPTSFEVAEAAALEVEGLRVEIIKEMHSPSRLSTPEQIMVCSTNLAQGSFGEHIEPALWSGKYRCAH